MTKGRRESPCCGLAVGGTVAAALILLLATGGGHDGGRAGLVGTGERHAQITPRRHTLDAVLKGISSRVEAARAASRERVKAKHGEHRGKLLKAEKLIHTQSEQIASLQARLKRAERAANTADGDRATKSGKAGVVVHRGEKLYHVMHSPGDRNVANHQDAVQYNYRHHDAAWDGNRVPTEGRGDRLDRHVSRYPDYDAPSSPGGYNFVYGKDETYAPQDYGSYYGPQAYYDGYYRGGDGSTERQTRNGAGRTGRGTQGRGRHVYAYASPYDRSEEFRQHENYVNMFYRWYTTATNENQQQSISDAQKWQYNAAIQQYDAYLRDATGRDT